MPVGAKLTALRRERGKTLADLESQTRIMGRHLSALENERWDDLPAPVYVRGYIQNYVRALGADPAPFLEEYSHDTGEHVEHPRLQRIPEQTVVPYRLDLHKIPPRAWRAIAIAVVVVALLVWGVTALLGGEKTPTPIAPETTTTPDATASGGAANTAATTPGAFVLKITVADGQSSWLQVRVDSLIAY